jgi:predicted secreted hydrolase
MHFGIRSISVVEVFFMPSLFDPAAIVDQIRSQSSEIFERITKTFVGDAEPLRDGTEFDPVTLPRDLAAHSNVQTEWWYYTGHFSTDTGREFGFELVFFKRRTDEDRFAVVPLRLIGNPFYFAHFALTDKIGKSFRYSHRKSANGPLDMPASAAETHYYLNVGDWSVRESNGIHILRASLDSGTTFEASLKPEKSVVLNGEGGVSYKDEGQASRYFAYTRMSVDGNLLAKGTSEHFTGSAWMDREFGTWSPTENQMGWDWFSIQLDNGCELMCYQLRNGKGEASSYSSGTFVDENGSVTPLSVVDFTISPIAFWKSPRSEAEYPGLWKIEVPRQGLDLTVTAIVEDQELDTRGSTMIIYWEGACEVNGSAGGATVSGDAYVELVGYDRSHESPNLAYFLVGNPAELLSIIGIK